VVRSFKKSNEPLFIIKYGEFLELNNVSRRSLLNRIIEFFLL